MSADLPNWAHELRVEVIAAVGEAPGATISGFATATGSCNTLSGSTLPATRLTVGAQAFGVGGIQARSTAVGWVGNCGAQWTVQYSAPGTLAGSLTDWVEPGVRCDNALGYPNRLPWDQSLHYSRGASHRGNLHLTQETYSDQRPVRRRRAAFAALADPVSRGAMLETCG